MELADNTTLTAALAGDRVALQTLVNKLTPVIQARVARRLLRSPSTKDIRQDVRDLCQDVFAHLFEKDARVLRGWDAGRGMSLENYVGLIAQRRVVSSLRSSKSNPWRETGQLDDIDEPGSTQADIERQVIAQDTLESVLDAMRAQLSPLGWRLFELLYIEECSVDDVRQETGMNADAIYAWRSRLRKVAKQCQGDLLDPDANMKRQTGPRI